jgi:hypothetical protein
VSTERDWRTPQKQGRAYRHCTYNYTACAPCFVSRPFFCLCLCLSCISVLFLRSPLFTNSAPSVEVPFHRHLSLNQLFILLVPAIVGLGFRNRYQRHGDVKTYRLVTLPSNAYKLNRARAVSNYYQPLVPRRLDIRLRAATRCFYYIKSAASRQAKSFAIL